MKDLNFDELIQLLAFYKQKLSDVELEMLKMQIKINQLNSIILERSESEKTTKKTK